MEDRELALKHHIVNEHNLHKKFVKHTNWHEMKKVHKLLHAVSGTIVEHEHE